MIVLMPDHCLLFTLLCVCRTYAVYITGLFLFQHNAKHHGNSYKTRRTRPRGYKTFFMLNSVKHENFPAHKC